MAIGAKDGIDQMLVRKYARERVDNTEQAQIMAMSAQKYWDLTQEVAQVQRVMYQVSSYITQKKHDANQKFLNGGAKQAG